MTKKVSKPAAAPEREPMGRVSLKLPRWMEDAIGRRVAEQIIDGQPGNASRIIRALLAQALKAEGEKPEAA